MAEFEGRTWAPVEFPDYPYEPDRHWYVTHPGKSESPEEIERELLGKGFCAIARDGLVYVRRDEAFEILTSGKWYIQLGRWIGHLWGSVKPL